MSNSRNDISKLIEKLRLDNSLLDKIKPPVFESVAAEIISRNKELIEVQRRAFGQLDYMGKFKNELGNITSFAVEAKMMRNLVGSNTVAQMAANAAKFNIDKSYLITNSAFSEAAKALAKQQIANIELIDRSGISRLLEQYKSDQIAFASSLVTKLNKLNLNTIFTYENPDSHTIDHINIEDIEIEQEQKSALISVDRLPLQVLSMILKNPQEVRNITPRQFEEFIADLLDQLGFSNVILTPRSADGGKDVIASHSINGIPLSFYFECKKYAEGNKIQLETLRALLGTMAHDARSVNKGVLVTTSSFTEGCKKFILSESRLDGKDYNGILGWIDELQKII